MRAVEAVEIDVETEWDHQNLRYSVEMDEQRKIRG
jgi:hypothetical protein